MDHSFVQILSSERVSPPTRAVLVERSKAGEQAYAFFSQREASLLERLVEAMLPQSKVGTAVPCANMIDMRLSSGESDGWRYVALPEDGAAYRAALYALGEELDEGDDTALAGLVARASRKEMDTPEFAMSRWLEEFRVEVTRFWLASAEGMQAIGYAGFADDRLTAADVPLGGGR